MRQYYIIKDGIKQGPFSLEELKNQQLHTDTLLWQETWTEPKKAKDAAIHIPEINVILNEFSQNTQTKKVPKKRKAVNILSSVLKASEGDLGEIQSLLTKKKEEDGNEKEEEKEEILENRPSFTATFYSFIGKQIDQLLENNQEKISDNLFFTKLNDIRDYYKTLNENRQRSFTFLCSCFIVFMMVTIFSFNFKVGLTFTVFWGGFVALNQLKFIDGLITTITDWTVLFTLVWLPKALKRLIAKVVKFIIFLIMLYFIGLYLGILYILYRIAIVFVNPNHLPSFEQGS